jgi:membrane protein
VRRAPGATADPPAASPPAAPSRHGAGARLWRLLRAAWSEYERDYARYFAIALVYYALLSLVPLLLLILATLGLILQFSDAAAAAERQLLETVQVNFGAELRASIERLLQTLRDDSMISTVVSFITLSVAASALFKHLRLTFRALWGQAPPLMSGTVLRIIRATFTEALIAFLMVFATGLLLLVSFALLALVQWAAGLVSRLPILGVHGAWLLALLPSLLIAPGIFAILFRFLPPKPLRWRDVALASALCGGAWLIGAELLALYGKFVSHEPSAYGTLGAILIVMLWMKVVSQMLFLGAELCKVVFRSRMRGETGTTASLSLRTRRPGFASRSR